MWLQFIVEHVAITQFNQFLHGYQPLKMFWSLSKTLCIHLKGFSTGEKKKYQIPSWLLFLISLLLPVFVIYQKTEDMKWNPRKSVSFPLKARTEHNPVQCLSMAGSILSLQARLFPFAGSEPKSAAQGWRDICLSHAFPSIPKEFPSWDSSPEGFEQPDMSPNRAHRVCPSPAITGCSYWSK